MKRNLIYIIGSLQVGGAERHLTRVLPLLAARGWSIQVFTLTGKGVLAEQLENHNIPVVPILSDKDLVKIRFFSVFSGSITAIIQRSYCILKLALKLRKEKNAIVNFFLPGAYLIGMFSAELARCKGPKVMSRRSLNFYQKHQPVLGWIERKLHSRTSAITGNSKAIIAQLENEEKVTKDNLYLIYNGVDTLPFLSGKAPDDLRKKLGIEKHTLVLIQIANLIPYKAHEDLLNALGKIKNTLPSSWCLICVGRDDGIGNALKKQTERLGLQSHILWLGMRKDVVDLLAIANIGILCSHSEGFSNAILEGMAAGLPMVVTDVGGNKEAVLDNETGYVVPAKDIEKLGNAILELANNPHKALEFGKAGRSRVEKYFSLDSCLQAYEALYESLSR